MIMSTHCGYTVLCIVYIQQAELFQRLGISPF